MTISLRIRLGDVGGFGVRGFERSPELMVTDLKTYWTDELNSGVGMNCWWEACTDPHEYMNEEARKRVQPFLDSGVADEFVLLSGGLLVYNRWKKGYNQPPADLLMTDMLTQTTTVLHAGKLSSQEEITNVVLPGQVFSSAKRLLVYASTRFQTGWSVAEHEEVNAIHFGGGFPIWTGMKFLVLTARANAQSWEPTISPDGKYVAFESHYYGADEDFGRIEYIKVGDPNSSKPAASALQLTPKTLNGKRFDCRQPNFSPNGEKVVFQGRTEEAGGGMSDFSLYTIELLGGKTLQRITAFGEKSLYGEATDASFSPSGKLIVCSADGGTGSNPKLIIVRADLKEPATELDTGAATQLTFGDAYHGAPSWFHRPESTDLVVFEGAEEGDPELQSGGTGLYTVEVPKEETILSLMGG